ncbi:hypothetical protein DdX_15615 [Ditylenchus destructor]|uniref:F-box domain-containing protein n=1 Tax=Ditylenchus destructor TaxID=166010 RepID=A0AAD4MP68_9BILA|nr:hypothetical protein DdX_15615 [Ditylenchus destructor]
MSYSKPLPPFTFEVLCYLNRDQLERFSIVCHPLKNIIARYFRSKPYRVFDKLEIRGGIYALQYNHVQWHPNREDYSVQQFLAGQRRNGGSSYYSFAEMLPYLGTTVRISWTNIYVAGDITYNSEHIEQMESIARLRRNGKIWIYQKYGRLRAEDFQTILDSPTILQSRVLWIDNPHFSFKDYKILYTVNVIEIRHKNDKYIDLWQQYWQQFLDQPGIKPVVIIFLVAKSSTIYSIVFPR